MTRKLLGIVLIGYLTLSFANVSDAQAVRDISTLRTVVIDAGHGGRDPGAVGRTIQEKNVTLPVALKVGQLIKESHPDVKVIYTRDEDIFLALDERADIANRHAADLFISIHCNAVRNTRTPNGSETFVMGVDKSTANMEVAQRENAAIMHEEGYLLKYEGYDPNSPESFIIFSLTQNAYLEQSLAFASLIQKELPKTSIKNNRGIKQAGFIVLWRTTMPSVLVELGFITNEKDEKVLASKTGQEDLAKAITRAFTTYKENYDRSNNIAAKVPDPVKKEPEKTVTAQVVNPAKETAIVEKKEEVKKDSTPVQDSRLYKKQPEATAKPTIQKQEDRRGVRYYRVQIMASEDALIVEEREAQRYGDVRRIRENDMNKLTVGNFTSYNDAVAYCKKVRETYSDAFVVCFLNGQKVPLK